MLVSMRSTKGGTLVAVNVRLLVISDARVPSQTETSCNNYRRAYIDMLKSTNVPAYVIACCCSLVELKTAGDVDPGVVV